MGSLCFVDSARGREEILRRPGAHECRIDAGTLGGLGCHQRVIYAACLHKTRVRAGLHQPPVLQHQQSVGADNARQAMGEDERRTSLHEPIQGLLNDGFIFRVHRGERLVEHQDRRIA